MGSSASKSEYQCRYNCEESIDQKLIIERRVGVGSLPRDSIGVDLGQKDKGEGHKQNRIEVRKHENRVYQDNAPVTYEIEFASGFPGIGTVIALKNGQHGPQLEISEEQGEDEGRDYEKYDIFLSWITVTSVWKASMKDMRQREASHISAITIVVNE